MHTHSHYYVAQEEKLGLNFEDSPIRVPHKEIRERMETDPTREVYLMFSNAGAPQPTPPGVRLLSIPKPGQGARPPRAELQKQLESYSFLGSNALMASVDSIIVLGNRLTQRIRYLLNKCMQIGGLPLTAMEGPLKGGDILSATYKSFIFYLTRKQSTQQLKKMLPQELFDDWGEFLADEEEEEGEGENVRELFEEEDEAESTEDEGVLGQEFAASCLTLAELVEMKDSTELVGRLFSLLPLDDNEQMLLFSHFLCLLAERDLIASEAGVSMTPLGLRHKMKEFYISSFKDYRDEAAHLFSWMFPLGFKNTDVFETKELLLKTDLKLDDSFIRARQGVIDHLKDSITAQSPLLPDFGRDLISLSLSYIEGGVAVLDNELSKRKLQQKVKTRNRSTKGRKRQD